MNNWYVITGGPCSGKSTILKALSKKGYSVIYEAARTFIDSEIKKGKTLSEIRKNELQFQKKVLQLKKNIENKLPKEKVIFLERGIPDTIAYFRLCGVKNKKILNNLSRYGKYKKVFLLELLDYKKDYARTEDLKQAQKIEKLLEESYKNYEPIKVPKMSLAKRIDFIISKL